MTNAITNEYTREAARPTKRRAKAAVRLNWIFILAMVLNLALWALIIAIVIHVL